MNRLFRSSYGNLEAVITIPSGGANGHRELLHLRLESTNFWRVCAIITETAISGGSIIENMSKRHENTGHGDFEVLVAQGWGYIAHYTRINTTEVPPMDSYERLFASGNRPPLMNGDRPPLVNGNRLPLTNCDRPPLTNGDRPPVVNGNGLSLARGNIPTAGPGMEYRWRLSDAIVAYDECGQACKILGAAPLIQSWLSMSAHTRGATLETVVWDAERKLTHHRCPQGLLRQHMWRRGDVIVGPGNVIGPASLHYQVYPHILMALVPTTTGIREYRFISGAWQFITAVTNYPAVGFVYNKPPLDLTALHILASSKHQIIELERDRDDGSWNRTAARFPRNWNYPCTRVLRNLRLIPFSMSSDLGRLGIDVIALHPCSRRYPRSDAWEVLHWTLLFLGSGDAMWILSSVVVPRIEGMPL